jgi:hypothetical protein
MSYTTWLFLYLAGLMELDIRYRLTVHHLPATLITLLPLLAMAAPRSQRQSLRWSGAALTLGCAVVMARLLSLDFWNTERVDLALLSAGIGLGGLLATRAEQAEPEWSLVNWLVVAAGWLVGLWLPLGPWIAMGAAATLALWPRALQPERTVAGLSAPWLLFWIGMAISKPWWDSDDWGEWTVALWACGVACSYLPGVRRWRAPLPLLAIALFPLLYPWLANWLWAVPLGLLCGGALQASARPWPRAAGVALLAGMLLSYILHSNLELFGPLLWGAR